MASLDDLEGHLVEEEQTGCFDFRWFVSFLLKVVVCLRFLLVSLVGFSFGQWLFLDQFVAILS